MLEDSEQLYMDNLNMEKRVTKCRERPFGFA